MAISNSMVNTMTSSVIEPVRPPMRPPRNPTRVDGSKLEATSWISSALMPIVDSQLGRRLAPGDDLVLELRDQFGELRERDGNGPPERDAAAG